MTEWSGHVTSAVVGDSMVFTIDNGERNLLNPGVMGSLREQILSADSDEGVFGIVLTGAGNFFCGGLDVPAIRAGADPVEFASSLVSLLKIFPDLHTPVLAAVNGNAVASGASLVAVTDYSVAIPTALIGTQEVGLGVWPMIAQVPLIKAIGARAAMENIGSGEPFTAHRAQELGLINLLAPSENVLDECVAWIEKAARGRAVYRSGRPTIARFADLPTQKALDESLGTFVSMFS